jgi:hypothetical protein
VQIVLFLCIIFNFLFKNNKTQSLSLILNKEKRKKFIKNKILFCIIFQEITPSRVKVREAFQNRHKNRKKNSLNDFFIHSFSVFSVLRLPFFCFRLLYFFLSSVDDIFLCFFLLIFFVFCSLCKLNSQKNYRTRLPLTAQPN